jgi:hypothetical protein
MSSTTRPGEASNRKVGRPKGVKDKRRRRRRAPPLPAPENPDAFSINEFCRRHMMSRGTYNRLRDQGRGPREIKLVERVLISREAAADWRKQLEVATATAQNAAE